MQNEYEGTERRKFRRVVFSANERVYGEFAFNGFLGDLTSAKISDLGAGGLRFILARDDCGDIGVGSIIFLRKIKGIARFGFVSDIEIEIKWVLDTPEFENVMIGCQFINISKTIRKRINQLIEADLVQRYLILSN